MKRHATWEENATSEGVTLCGRPFSWKGRNDPPLIDNADPDCKRCLKSIRKRTDGC